mgnify:CR=1 FL=1
MYDNVVLKSSFLANHRGHDKILGFYTFTHYDLSMKLDGGYMKCITTLIGELKQRHFEILLILYIRRFIKP